MQPAHVLHNALVSITAYQQAAQWPNTRIAAYRVGGNCGRSVDPQHRSITSHSPTGCTSHNITLSECVCWEIPHTHTHRYGSKTPTCTTFTWAQAHAKTGGRKYTLDSTSHCFRRLLNNLVPFPWNPQSTHEAHETSESKKKQMPVSQRLTSAAMRPPNADTHVSYLLDIIGVFSVCWRWGGGRFLWRYLQCVPEQE